MMLAGTGAEFRGVKMIGVPYVDRLHEPHSTKHWRGYVLFMTASTEHRRMHWHFA